MLRFRAKVMADLSRFNLLEFLKDTESLAKNLNGYIEYIELMALDFHIDILIREFVWSCMAKKKGCDILSDGLLGRASEKELAAAEVLKWLGIVVKAEVSETVMREYECNRRLNNDRNPPPRDILEALDIWRLHAGFLNRGWAQARLKNSIHEYSNYFSEKEAMRFKEVCAAVDARPAYWCALGDEKAKGNDIWTPVKPKGPGSYNRELYEYLQKQDKTKNIPTVEQLVNDWRKNPPEGIEVHPTKTEIYYHTKIERKPATSESIEAAIRRLAKKHR